ncbi:hypothetical protein RM780_10475 [Streptomyces sp. DSM 44917]|uniref:Uncharacterized protein n=1 Tax=Streptomyces boetiae TaxID=3075541 RepID=A0ABU2L7S5_9ACTN|nr:hypothetical protein [Streptomyces sp. DSM 44917]MDT0307387.1 hypothetical protein [Streptomyces sp. DSM 44917]
MRQNDSGAVVGVTVDAASIRQGDQLLMGGQVFTVRDIRALPRGARRLDFGSGESFTMSPATVLYAMRRVDPRRHIGG